MSEVCRFAPTTSGRAHPGTLAAATLAWMDARMLGAKFILRMEDIDPSADRNEFREGLLDDLKWFGLDWDELVWQSQCRASHEELMDILAKTGRLYECSCSRTSVKTNGVPSVAGGFIYQGTCRHKKITDWRSSKNNIRIDLSDFDISMHDESGVDLSQAIKKCMGDPVLVRRDGGFTYQLAVVADDHFSSVSRIIRGSDIATSTATQVALRQLAGWPVPVYRHHLLLLETCGEKFAKFHGAVGADTLRRFYSADELRGIIAEAIGIHPAYLHTTNSDSIDKVEPVKIEELLAGFSWENVGKKDIVMDWNGEVLRRIA